MASVNTATTAEQVRNILYHPLVWVSCAWVPGKAAKSGALEGYRSSDLQPFGTYRRMSAGNCAVSGLCLPVIMSPRHAPRPRAPAHALGCTVQPWEPSHFAAQC